MRDQDGLERHTDAAARIHHTTSIPKNSAEPKPNAGVQLDAKELKARISLRAFLEAEGHKLTKSGKYWKCRCPFHGDRTPSFVVYETDVYAKCFGCDWKGDIFDYVRQKKECSFRDALEYVARLKELHGTNEAKPEVALTRVIEEYRLTEKDLQEIGRTTQNLATKAWLCEKIAKERNWKGKTIERLAKARHVGSGGDTLDFIYKTGIKSRFWPGRDFFWHAGKPHIWRWDVLQKAHTAYLTEGETDAITLLDSGMEKDGVVVVSAPNAGTFYPEWAEMFKEKEVVLCYDADAAGDKGTQKAGTLLLPVARSVKVFPLGEVWS